MIMNTNVCIMTTGVTMQAMLCSAAADVHEELPPEVEVMHERCFKFRITDEDILYNTGNFLDYRLKPRDVWLGEKIDETYLIRQQNVRRDSRPLRFDIIAMNIFFHLYSHVELPRHKDFYDTKCSDLNQIPIPEQSILRKGYNAWRDYKGLVYEGGCHAPKYTNMDPIVKKYLIGLAKHMCVRLGKNPRRGSKITVAGIEWTYTHTIPKKQDRRHTMPRRAASDSACQGCRRFPQVPPKHKSPPPPTQFHDATNKRRPGAKSPPPIMPAQGNWADIQADLENMDWNEDPRTRSGPF